MLHIRNTPGGHASKGRKDIPGRRSTARRFRPSRGSQGQEVHSSNVFPSTLISHRLGKAFWSASIDGPHSGSRWCGVRSVPAELRVPPTMEL
jgi:hypothetical protein